MAEEGSPISNNDLIFLVLKFLKEQKLTRTADLLMEEQGYFSMNKFETHINNKFWMRAYDYLLSFFPESVVLDVYLQVILYEFNKLQHFATESGSNRSRIDALLSALSVLPLSEELKQKEVEDLTRIASASDEDIEIVKHELFTRLKKLIENNPYIRGSTEFPRLRDTSLQQLIGQSYFRKQAQGTSSQGSEGHLSAGPSRSFHPPPARPPRPNKKPILKGDFKGGPTSMLTETKNSSQIQLSKLPQSQMTEENQQIVRLSYTNSGKKILALLSNGLHLVQNCVFDGKEKLYPDKKQPALVNDLRSANTAVDYSCFALSEDDSLLVSTSGGRISLYNPQTLEFIARSIPPRPAATSLAFRPSNNYVIARGKDNFIIEIFYLITDQVKWKLKGHTGRVTGLAFSKELNSLVSSGEDAQIIVWSTNNWERGMTTSLEIPLARRDTAAPRIEVQFHPDGIHFLVVHQTQLAIYKAPSLERIKEWPAVIFSPPVHRATFSCDGQLIYSSFLDGSLRIFSNSVTNLELLHIIDATAYIPSLGRTLGLSLYHPIAAHPKDRNEFAVGTMHGEIYLLKVLPSQGQWGDSSQLLQPSSSDVPEVHEMGQGDDQAAIRRFYRFL